MAPASKCDMHTLLLLSHTGRGTKPKTMLSKISQTWTNTMSSLCVESKCAHRRREQKGKAFGKRKRAENGRETGAVGDENKREREISVYERERYLYMKEWYLYIKESDIYIWKAVMKPITLETQKTSKTSNLENPQNLRCRQAESPTWLLFAFHFLFFF